MTVVARLTLGHLCKKRFFLQLPLIDFCQCLPRAQNHVDEKAADEEDRYQRGCQYLRQEILSSRTNVPERPNNQTQPEYDSEGNNKANDNTQ